MEIENKFVAWDFDLAFYLRIKHEHEKNQKQNKKYDSKVKSQNLSSSFLSGIYEEIEAAGN